MYKVFPVHMVRWQDKADSLRLIRTAVFIREQQVPEELEWDEFDAISLHALALNDDGQPIGTARLLPDGHIGRMAVLREWRDKGVGSAILQRLLEELIKRNALQAILNAQTSATKFYEKFGFQREGEIFIEASIPHVKMRILLK